MHKIFLAVSSMIVSGFLMKSWKKLHEKPETKEDIYKCKKAELLSRLGTISDLEAALRQHRAPDQADAMAMPPGRLY